MIAIKLFIYQFHFMTANTAFSFIPPHNANVEDSAALSPSGQGM